MPAPTKTFVFRFLVLLACTVALYSLMTHHHLVSLHSLYKRFKLSSTSLGAHGFGRYNNMSYTVFSTDTLPADDRLMATIGNGFLATRIYSDSIFVSGVYNGRGREPSHRARIPSTVAIRMSLQGNAVETTTNEYSLDVQKALFTHRIEGRGFHIQELIYAHRKLENLLVVEIRAQNWQGEPLRINFVETQSNKSEDINFTEVPKSKLPPDSSGIKARYGFIYTTEEEKSEKVGVAVVSSKVPDSVIIQAKDNRTYYFVTAIVSTLNTVGFLESAYSCHKQAISLLSRAGGLFASHAEAWAELWQQSGIEVEGDVKLAQAIHGSLYYILRYVNAFGN